jgi:ABC-type sugar transport system ATPase subunit
MTIVVASSDTAEVLGLCDTIATFYRGRMTSIRPRNAWTEEELTREVMHSQEDAST